LKNFKRGVKEKVIPVYENRVKIAERVEEFDTYKEHHKIEDGHIGKVYDKTLQAADVLETAFEKESYGGMYSSTIDRKSLEVMALYHDTGMDGNVSAEKKYWSEAYEGQFRKNHSVQSAIYALCDGS